MARPLKKELLFLLLPLYIYYILAKLVNIFNVIFDPRV